MGKTLNLGLSVPMLEAFISIEVPFSQGNPSFHVKLTKNKNQKPKTQNTTHPKKQRVCPEFCMEWGCRSTVSSESFPDMPPSGLPLHPESFGLFLGC